MQFGMPTLIELPSLDETASLCRELGLDFIELNMNLPEYQLGALTAEMLREHQRSDLYFTLHLDESFNVWDFNPLVSQAYFDTLLAAIRLAREAGIPIINLHMHRGVYLTLPGERVFLFDRYRDHFMHKTEALRKVCEAAVAGSGVKICIENCGGFTGFQLDALGLLLESDAFGLTFDIGHSHAAGERDAAFIRSRADKLWHMHIHDAIGAKNHLAIGSGEIDVAEKLALARSQGCRCVLEVKTVEGLRESVNILRGKFT
jgi:sugar phosphate isomerase/epimerase